MSWTRNPWFGVFLLVGMLGVSLMFTTTAAADDDVKAETSVTTGEGSPKTPAADEADGKKEAEVPLTPVEALKKETTYTINTLIMFICAVLVLFMQAGFAMLEVGLNSAKNTVNILF
jgi:Amt family ammonium transporter